MPLTFPAPASSARRMLQMKGSMGTHGFTFDLDPVLLDLSVVQIRYYGVVFALTLFTAYLVWCWQCKRAGVNKDQTDAILVYGTLGTIIGARLGHCFFYDWADVYSKNPIRILYFWEGGLSSHGATIGILLALVVYCLRYKLPYLAITDRFTFSAAIGAAGIRLANFLNSEVVGRVTDVPWAVRFLRFPEPGGLPSQPRHPSQLYEFAIGIFVLLLLLLVDRLAGRGKRPLGLLTGVFMTVYFSLRYCVEFVKEYQAPTVEDIAHHGLTMGQYLSVLPVFLGLGLLVYALTAGRRRAAELCAAQGSPEPDANAEK